MLFHLCLRLSIPHPDQIPKYLTADQLRDWFAFNEVDDFTSTREDVRSAISSCWSRGVPFKDIPIEYPHTKAPDISDEELDDIIQEMEEANDDGATGTTSDQDNG